MGSVRARAALGATVVVAAALVAAGVLLLTLLRGNLDERVDLRATLAARDVATQLATDTRLDELEFGGDGPVQVLDGEGVLIAVSEGLEEIRGTASAEVRPRRPSWESEETRGAATQPSRGNAGPVADGGDDDGEGWADDGDEGDDGTASGGGGGERADAVDGAADQDEQDEQDEQGDDLDGQDDRKDGGSDDEDEPLRPGEVDEDAETVDGSAVVDGQHGAYRFAVVNAVTTRGEDVVVYAGAAREVEEAAVDSVRTSMLAGLPALLLVVAGVTWLVTRRALRPVDGIRREMVAIMRSSDLSRRVPEPASRDEVGRLAVATNETLAALEASVERQRRFVADASHELRSPIASLRTQLEVGAAHPELLDLPGAVKDTVRLQDLAADLLLLARLDAGERPATASVELAGLVRDALAERGGDRVAVRVEELTAVTVSGSRGQLARVLGNLLDNAQRHAASAVRVSVRRETEAQGPDGGPGAGGGATVAGGPVAVAVVEVADDGAGVPEADRERVFQRFVRLDDARTRDEGGAGLGLAIARDVAVRHGGSLAVDRAPEGGARFVLRLPAA